MKMLLEGAIVHEFVHQNISTVLMAVAYKRNQVPMVYS
jgi:hypothetical protein